MTKSKNPLISIIVPTYNRPELIKKTINSLLNQTYTNIEIIIVNNYPQLNLKSFISSINDNRIKYFIESKKNTANARNLGLKHASGQYICFCDDDDLYLPNKVKLQLKFMQTNPQLGFSYHNFYFKKNNKLTLGIVKKAPTNFIDLITANFFTIHSGSLMIKKKCFIKVKGFNSKLPSNEDADFNYQLASKFKFRYLSKPLTIYQLHSKNKKKTLQRKHYLNIEKVKVKYLKKISNPTNPQKHKLNYHQARLFLFQGQLKKSRQHFFKSIRFKPITFWPYLLLASSLLKPTAFNQLIFPTLPTLESFTSSLKQTLLFQKKPHTSLSLD